MAIYQDQLMQHLRGLGIADPNSLYGGSTGFLKPEGGTIDDQFGTSWQHEFGGGSGQTQLPYYYMNQLNKLAKDSGYSNNNYTDGALPWSQFVGFNDGTGKYSARMDDPNSPFANQNFVSGKSALDAKYADIGNRMQVDEGLLGSTLNYWKDPSGNYNGRWINNVDSIKYDPKYGLYLEPNSAGEYDVGSHAANQGSFLSSIFTDPIWLTTLSFGLGAALAPAAEGLAATAPAGAEAGTGAIGETAANLAPEFGGGGLSDWFSQAGDWLKQNNPFSNFGSVDKFAPSTNNVYSMLGFEQPSFFPQSIQGEGLFGQLGVTGEFGGMSYAPWAEQLAAGASPAQISAWFPQQTSLFDQAKSFYDKYAKPVKQAQTAGKLLGLDGNTSGRTGIVQQPAQQEPDYGIAPTTYYPNTGIPNWGGFPQPVSHGNDGMVFGGQTQNQGGGGFGVPSGGMSSYFDYLPDYIKKGMIR